MNAHAKPGNQFDNYSNEMLADEIGDEDRKTKAAEARLKELKDEAKRRGIESAAGRVYRINIDTGERSTLDTKALRELLGDALDPYYKKSPTCTLRISALFQQPEVVG